MLELDSIGMWIIAKIKIARMGMRICFDQIVTPTMNASDDHDFDYWSKVSPDQMLMRMRMPQIAHSSGSPCSCS